jgi:hypothetical protein
MSDTAAWNVEIELTEDDTHTRADAILVVAGRRYHGWGRARRNPADPDIPKIGEELATARALSDLAHQLLHAAADDIEKFEGRPVELHG